MFGDLELQKSGEKNLEIWENLERIMKLEIGNDVKIWRKKYGNCRETWILGKCLDI